MKKALVSGISGQDGSYLAELLITKGYDVYGTQRRTSTITTERIDHIFEADNKKTFYADLADANSLINVLLKVKPDEIYNIGSMSHVRISFEIPEYTAQVTGVGALRWLEALRSLGMTNVKYYQASSSEMFGISPPPQNENTPMLPQSPYGCAKLFAYHITKVYRAGYGMFACNGILFNHESERRSMNFVTQKIVYAAVNIKMGKQDKVRLGNLDAKRDWGFAGDYCIPSDVPIFTTQGWKYQTEIQVGDEIINYDIINNCLARDRVVRKVEKQYTGEMITLIGRGVYLRCIPEHKIYYQKRYSNGKGDWGGWRKCTAMEFYEMLGNACRSIKYRYRLPDCQNYNVVDYDGVTDDKLYLIGVLLAEGCLASGGGGGGIRISVSQSHIANRVIHEKIQRVVARLGLETRLRNRNDGVTEWIFNAKSSLEICGWFDSYDVHMMPRYCYQLSKRQAKILFEAMMDCDGCWGAMCYTTNRYLLATDFQTIAYLAGYRTGKISNQGGIYNVFLICQRKKYAYVQQVLKEPCVGENVWCVETSNGTIISRDKDCITTSGNCDGIYRIMQHSVPDDFVLATSEQYSVREFAEKVFNQLGLNCYDYVIFDKAFTRPNEVPSLMGDSTKARTVLGWKPEVTFEGLVDRMIKGAWDNVRNNTQRLAFSDGWKYSRHTQGQ